MVAKLLAVRDWVNSLTWTEVIFMIGIIFLAIGGIGAVVHEFTNRGRSASLRIDGPGKPQTMTLLDESFEAVPGQLYKISYEQTVKIDGMALSPHRSMHHIVAFVKWYGADGAVISANRIYRADIYYPGSPMSMINGTVLAPEGAVAGRLCTLQEVNVHDFTDTGEWVSVDWSIGNIRYEVVK